MNGSGLTCILLFEAAGCQPLLMDCKTREKFVTIKYLQNGRAPAGPFTQTSVFAII